MPCTDSSGLLLPWLGLAVQVLGMVVQPDIRYSTSSPNHSVRLKSKGFSITPKAAQGIRFLYLCWVLW